VPLGKRQEAVALGNNAVMFSLAKNIQASEAVASQFLEQAV